jgi:ubiquinone/menaquinone biosynthesis C-methylase UbiE/glycosyltransferase involved in cell wall biosynthesis
VGTDIPRASSAGPSAGSERRSPREVSIRSIATVADEIIVGDNGSTDRTPEILTELKDELQDRLIVLREPELDIKDLTNVLIERTRFRWVIRWDADFVARTDGPQSIFHLRKWLFDHDPRRYVFVYPKMIELCGDLFHQRPETATRTDCHCFAYSDHLRYVYGWSGYESPKVPRWYRVLKYETPTFFHVDVKPVRRMFLSFLWKQYLLDPEGPRYPRFEAYLETKLKEQWEGQGIDEAAALWAASAFRELVPYDRNRFGDYPMLLRPFLHNPHYRLRYDNTQIVGQQCLEHQQLLPPPTPSKAPIFVTPNSHQAKIKSIYEHKSVAERYTRTRFSRPLGAVQHRIQFQTLNDAIKHYKVRNILEIACGPARLTAELSGFEKGVAIDNSHEMLSLAKRIVPNISQWTFLRADAFNLHLNQKFDLIYSFRFLRHFTLIDRRKIYTTVTNLLNESGLFIFDAVHYDKQNFVKYCERKGDIPIYDEIYSKTDLLITELELAGFEVLELKKLVRHFYIQAAISRVTHVLRLNAIGEHIINLFEDLDYGRPLEWIVICRKK